MAHFAKLDENNVVITVLRGRDEDEDKELELSERTGDTYRRTSYNTSGGVHSNGGTPFRYNYAGIGDTFNPTIGPDGAFIPKKVFNSWVLNTTTCLWEPPIPKPNDEKKYFWNEDIVSWDEVN